MAKEQSVPAQAASKVCGIDPRFVVDGRPLQTYVRHHSTRRWKESGQTVLAIDFARYLNQEAYAAFPTQEQRIETLVLRSEARYLVQAILDPETNEVLKPGMEAPPVAEVMERPVDASGIKTYADLLAAIAKANYEIATEIGLFPAAKDV